MIRRIWGTRVEVMPIVTVAMGVGGGGGVGGWGLGGGEGVPPESNWRRWLKADKNENPTKILSQKLAPKKSHTPNFCAFESAVRKSWRKS